MGGVAVGTALSGRPPRRSQRAELLHWAPALGPKVEALVWIGMHDANWRDPCPDKTVHARPRHVGFLVAPVESAHPVPDDLVAEVCN